MSATKPSGPGVGFNHNVKYESRVYHVQTEDSGLPHAHYITHLFVGGNIVASTKTSYADKAADADLAKTVRHLMESQHKKMLKRLVSGEFNDLAERLAATHYEPGVLATGQTGPEAVNAAPSAPAPLRTPVSVQPVEGPALNPSLAPIAPRPPAAPARPAMPPASMQPSAARPAPALPSLLQPAAGQSPPRPAAVQTQPAFVRPAPPKPPVLQPSAPPPAARPPLVPLPRAPIPQQPVWQAAPPGASPAPAPRQPGAPLPAVTRSPPLAPRPAVPPPRMVPVVAPPIPRPVAPAAAPPRPAAPARAAPPSLFGEQPVETAHDDLPTLFAEELISEKSLDEVILAFLSADLEPHK